MNRILSLVVLLAMVMMPALAVAGDFPTDQGSLMASGGFQFTSSGGDAYEDENGDRSTSFGMDPGLSYFVIPGLAVGMKVILERFTQGEYNSTDYGVGPQIMYFVGGNKPRAQIKGATYPFGRAALLYTKHDWESEVADGGFSWMRWRFGGGVLHMLSGAVGIFGEAAYEIGTYEPNEGDSESGNRFMGIVGLTHFIY